MSQPSPIHRPTHTCSRLARLAIQKEQVQTPTTSNEPSDPSSSSCGFTHPSLAPEPSLSLRPSGTFTLVQKIDTLPKPTEEMSVLKERFTQKIDTQIALLKKELASFFVINKLIKTEKKLSLTRLNKRIGECTKCAQIEKVLLDAMAEPILVSGIKSRVKKLLQECLAQTTKHDLLSKQPTIILTNMIAGFLTQKDTLPLCRASRSWQKLAPDLKKTASQILWQKRCLELGLKAEALLPLKKDNLTDYQLLHSRLSRLHVNVRGALSGEIVCLLTGRKDYIAQNSEALNNLVLPCGINAYHIAALSGSKSLLQQAIRTLNLPIKSQDKEGRNTLHFAALSGSVELVKYVLEELKLSKVDKDKYGRNLLHYAAWSGSVELVKYVLANLQFSKEDKDTYGGNLLHYAAWSGSAELVKYVIDVVKISKNSELSGSQNLLHFAAWSGSIELIKYALGVLKLPKKSKDSLGRNLLLWAVRGGSIECVKYALIDLKLPKESTDNDNANSVHYAAVSGSVEMIKYVLGESSLSHESQGNFGKNALHYAAYFNNVEVVRYLIQDLGMRADSLNYRGQTPLWYAQQEKNTEVLAFLEQELARLQA